MIFGIDVLVGVLRQRDLRVTEDLHDDAGVVLHLDDAVGSKTTALLGRALPTRRADLVPEGVEPAVAEGLDVPHHRGRRRPRR
jgi:hypothetical protein